MSSAWLLCGRLRAAALVSPWESCLSSLWPGGSRQNKTDASSEPPTQASDQRTALALFGFFRLWVGSAAKASQGRPRASKGVQGRPMAQDASLPALQAQPGPGPGPRPGRLSSDA